MRWQDEFRQFFPITGPRLRQHRLHQSAVAQVASAVADFFDGIAHARSDKPGWLADADAARAPGPADRRRRAGWPYQEHDRGLNTVAQGLPWREGDNLVVDDQEHPSNALPWLSLRRRGVDVRVASSGGHRYTVDDIWARVDARTRLVALSWVQYATGLRSDIAAGPAARRAASGWWWTAWAPACCARGSTTGAWTRSPAARTRACSARWAWASASVAGAAGRWIRRTWAVRWPVAGQVRTRWRVAAPDRQDARGWRPAI